MHVEMANKEDPDETASSERCLCRPFMEQTSVQNFLTFPIVIYSLP